MARKKKAVVLPNHPDFPDKWASKVPEPWSHTAEGMTREEMEKEVVSCEMSIEATEKDVADDTKIQELKENLKYLQEGYKEVLGTQKAKIKFLLYLMNSRGYDVIVKRDESEEE
jgi:hypothetical protein